MAGIGRIGDCMSRIYMDRGMRPSADLRADHAASIGGLYRTNIEDSEKPYSIPETSRDGIVPSN